ncbi:hypothetical protein HZB78_00335 [Candidatus Collierbacteria bacterium]|nr:hypothetical protein [Candidatus Collierbacteria bacterium]
MPESAAEPTPNYPSEVDRENYLDSLEQADQHNVEAVSDAFLSHLTKNGKTGILIAVGGTVKSATFGIPREDVDLLAVINGANDFDDWLEQIKQVSQETGIAVSKVLKPVPDREYDIPNFNIHDGSVELAPDLGVPIEIVNTEVWKNVETALEELRAEASSFSVLAQS